MSHQDCAHLYQETDQLPRDRLLLRRQMLISTIASRYRSTSFPEGFPLKHAKLETHLVANFFWLIFPINLSTFHCVRVLARAKLEELSTVQLDSKGQQQSRAVDPDL